MVDFCIFSNMDVCWALIAYVNGNCNASLTLCVGKYRGTLRGSLVSSAQKDRGLSPSVYAEDAKEEDESLRTLRSLRQKIVKDRGLSPSV